MSTQQQQILDDIKAAMKARETEKLSTLRMLNSAIKNKGIEVRPKELTDDDVLSVIKKAVKQRQEAIEQYKAAGRQDLVDKEAAELKVLEAYMPEQMSEEKIKEVVAAVIKDTGADSMKAMGAVMKETIARCNGAADNKVVSALVKSALQ